MNGDDRVVIVCLIRMKKCVGIVRPFCVMVTTTFFSFPVYVSPLPVSFAYSLSIATSNVVRKPMISRACCAEYYRTIMA